MRDSTRGPDDPRRGFVDLEHSPTALVGLEDHQLYVLLNDEGFSDAAFEVLAVALVGYARPVLVKWIGNGGIYRECARCGWPVSPTDAERSVLEAEHDEVDELVNETLAEALAQLRAQASTGEHKWDPAGGASLRTYFVTGCVRRFPNVYRRWGRELRRRPPTDSYSHDDRMVAGLESTDDVEQLIVSVTRTREMLTAMPPHVREILELLIEGRSYAEIAQITGARSARAVEGVLQRYRTRQRASGAQW